VKYRHRVLNQPIEERLQEIFHNIARDNQFEIISMEGDMDHIHLLISLSPQHYIPNIVKALKGSSARYLFKEFPQLKQKLWGGNFWNPSYFISSVGDTNEEQIKQYISEQKTKTRKYVRKK
jgi:putative transposase